MKASRALEHTVFGVDINIAAGELMLLCERYVPRIASRGQTTCAFQLEAPHQRFYMPAKLCRMIVKLEVAAVRSTRSQGTAAGARDAPTLVSITTDERLEVLRMCRVD